MKEKFIPDTAGMSLDEQAGVAFSQKKLSERRSNRFKQGTEEVKETRFYDEADFQKPKERHRRNQ